MNNNTIAENRDDVCSQEITEQIINAPILSTCNPQELARIIPKINKKKFTAGDTIFKAGTPAANLYLVSKGSIKLLSGRRVLAKVDTGYVGEEAVVGMTNYLTDAIADQDTEVLVISQEAINKLVKRNPTLEKDFYAWLLKHYSRENLEPVNKSKGTSPGQVMNIRQLAGWVGSILFPALTLYLGEKMGLDWNSKIFLAVFSSVITMWVFRLSAEFVPCLLAILILVFLGIAPASIVLSGFTSGSFFMAMSVFGLAVVLTASGVTYRFVLIALKYVPRSRFGYALSLFLTGFFLTPVIPSANGRVSMITPFVIDIVESVDYTARGKAATQLAAVSFAGLSLFSGAFISSKAINFVVFGLLPLQVKEQFNWVNWFLASSVFVLFMFVVLLVSTLMFRSDEVPNLSKRQLDAQLEILGPLNTKEYAAIAGILIFFIGIITSSIHKLESAWIGLAVLYVFLALEVLTKKQFQKEVDWPFLIYLGGLIGLAETMSYIGLDQWIGSNLTWMGQHMRDDFLIFVLLLAISITLLRIAIPNNALVLIFATIFIPMAQINGINPWVIGFIILNMSDTWSLPYQCTYYLQFIEITKGYNLFDQKAMLRFNAYANIIRLAAIYISIPFWRLWGII